MEESAQRIKQRDRWACKRCGKKFVDLVVHCFKSYISEDSLITLCKECETWCKDNVEESATVCNKLITTNKIILIGDCHGNFKKLDSVLAQELPFDFFLSVGDVGTLKDVTPDNIGYIDRWASCGYFIEGNHDDVNFFTRLELSQEIRGLHVANLNGVLKSRTFLKDKPANISFREVLYLSHLKDVDILVTHQPPTGLFSTSGEAVLEELSNYMVPKIHISGHIHSYKLRFHLRTFVISLPMIHKGYAVAYFQGKDLRNLEVILKRGKKFIRV